MLTDVTLRRGSGIEMAENVSHFETTEVGAQWG